MVLESISASNARRPLCSFAALSIRTRPSPSSRRENVAAVQRKYGAIGFDAPDARYPHRDDRIAALRGLAQEYCPNDAALKRLARIVHSADFPSATNLTVEGAGLRAISRGFPLVARDDSETVERATFLYDALYAGLQEQQEP